MIETTRDHEMLLLLIRGCKDEKVTITINGYTFEGTVKDFVLERDIHTTQERFRLEGIL